MKKNLVVFAVMLFVVGLALVESGCAKQSLKTKKDKVSYSIGWDIGSSFKKQSIDMNFDALLMGIKGAAGDAKSLLTEDEIKDVLQEFQVEQREKMTKQRSESEGKNKKEGEEFLAKNKKEKGIKVTSSGLQYRVIKEGKGAKPGKNDKVTVHYEGKLIDGTVFDSSYDRGSPATFPVGGVIPGWTEALQLMKAGSKCELFIPSELAYGTRGAGGNIGPNATLIFTVELISIEKK